MPRKYAKQKDTPELFAKVFKVINGLKDKRSYITVRRVANEIHAKLEQMGLRPNSRNVLLQVRRALKFGVQRNLFLHKAGKYRLAIKEASAKTSTKTSTKTSMKTSTKPSTRPSRRELVPMDSLELLKARKSKQKSKNSETKKSRSGRQEHTASCRKRHKKRSRPNKRYLSRKCKSRNYKKSVKEKVSSTSHSRKLGDVSAGETTNAENTKSGSVEKQENAVSQNDIHHWNNKQEAIDKSKYGKQSRKSRLRYSSYKGSVTDSDTPKSRRNKKRKVKNLKEIENLSSDNALSGLSTSTAIAAAIMIMMSLWYGYR